MSVVEFSKPTAPSTIIGTSGKEKEVKLKKSQIGELAQSHTETMRKIQPLIEVNLFWENEIIF